MLNCLCQASIFIVSAERNNFQHLAGVQYSSSADDFFEKCINDTLTESDIILYKKGKSSAEIKGSNRRKIQVLPDIIGIFTLRCLVQEDFSRNRLFCSFAATDTICTIGFTVAANTKPMTLLKGNQLDESKARPLELVLRRNRGDSSFNSIVCGSADSLISYEDCLSGMLSEDLHTLIDERKKALTSNNEESGS